MDAIILAGGLGRRLRDVVLDRPKPMVNVNGRPFILYLFDQLIEFGLRRVIVSTGYMGDYFPRELGTAYRGLEICFSEEQECLGTGGALKLAAKQLRSDNVLIMNGDSYLEVDFVELFSYHCRWDSQVTMALTKVDDGSQFGQVEIDPFGEIVRFEEKVPGQGGTSWVNAGKYFIRMDIINKLPPTYPLSLERDVFPAMVGRKFFGYKTKGKFIDIGTPETLELAQSLFGQIEN